VSDTELVRRAAAEMQNDNDDATWPFVGDLLDECADLAEFNTPIRELAIAVARVYLGES
jgi:hypothetical protein